MDVQETVSRSEFETMRAERDQYREWWQNIGETNGELRDENAKLRSQLFVMRAHNRAQERDSQGD